MAVEKTFWINTISLEHVLLGVAGGFTQADHGRPTRLARLRPDDGIVFYSPRTAMRDGAPLQEFTAAGRVDGAEPYQVEVSAELRPWRLSVAFFPVVAVPARPLVADLSFVQDPARWGYPFRRGLFQVTLDDFVRITSGMGVPPPSTW